MKESIHPKNRLGRLERRATAWSHRKQKFFIAIAIAFLMLQLLFLGLMSYLYGSLWKSQRRFAAFHVLYLDFDGGIIGRALDLAYQQLKGPSFPTFISRGMVDYPSPAAALQSVKDGDFWAAIFANTGASDRLTAALQGGKTASSYDPSTAITYIWNEVRYPPFSDEAFLVNFEALSNLVRSTYLELNGTFALQAINTTDQASLRVLFNPVEFSAENIMPTTHGTRLLYNTVSMVIPLLQQFFLLLIMNGISHELQLYSKIPLHISGLVRLGISIAYDFIGSLCMAGYIWAFRESWPVNGSQFVLTWMILWLLFHIHFVVLDTMTAFVPLPGIPFLLLTWIILNITSSLSPFEINPGFYRWGYALPAREAYVVLTDIWSSGSVPQLHRALPVLFCWWIVGLAAAAYGHSHRCHKAWMLHKKMEDASKPPGHLAQQQGTGRSEDNSVLEKTPSDRLVEAAYFYRSNYGPSVPIPPQLARMFALTPGLEPRQTRLELQVKDQSAHWESGRERVDDDDGSMETIDGIPINQIPTAEV